MSLINQVLKDLEHRHAGGVHGVARAVRPLPEGAPRRGLWIILGLVATASVAGAAWWYLSPQSALARSTQLGDPAPSKVGSPTVGTVVPVVAAPIPAVVTPAPDVGSTQVAGTSAPVPDQRKDKQTSTQIAHAAPQISGLLQAAAPVAKDFPEARVAARSPASSPLPQRQRAVEDAATASETTLEVESETHRPMPRTLPKADPKISDSSVPVKPHVAGAAGPEELKPEGSEPAANIDKQVRAPTERERAEAEFRGAMSDLGAGDGNRAEDKLRAALAIDPLLDKARQALLGLYIERGQREDAEQLLEERLRMDRRPAGFALALARLQLARGANSEALATLQQSLPNGEANADYQAMLANALGRLGQHKQAAERFEMAARLAPRNPVWLMGLGVELRADNRPSEARVAFRRARELGGLNPQLASFVDQQLTELK
jgi:MSHA biogenesis protein MshN